MLEQVYTFIQGLNNEGYGQECAIIGQLNSGPPINSNFLIGTNNVANEPGCFLIGTNNTSTSGSYILGNACTFTSSSYVVVGYFNTDDFA